MIFLNGNELALSELFEGERCLLEEKVDLVRELFSMLFERFLYNKGIDIQSEDIEYTYLLIKLYFTLTQTISYVIWLL